MPENVLNPAYIGTRLDVVQLIEVSPVIVLDLGCSNGAMGREIKKRFSQTKVIGIELNPLLAEEAREFLDFVIQGDLDTEDWWLTLKGQEFDMVICADVLEHLKDTEVLLQRVYKMMAFEGSLIISVPNVRHWSTLYYLVLKGEWPMRNSGLFDRTHLRFFTYRSIKRLLQENGFHVNRIIGKFSFYDQPKTPGHKIGKLLYRVPAIKEFITYQWILICQKKHM